MSRVVRTTYQCPRCGQHLYQFEHGGYAFPYGPQIVQCPKCNAQIRTGLKPPTPIDLIKRCLGLAVFPVIVLAIAYYFSGGTILESDGILIFGIVLVIFWGFTVYHYFNAREYYEKNGSSYNREP